jgi:hypothetical protein
MQYTLYNTKSRKYLNGGDIWQNGEPRETFSLGTCRKWLKSKYAARPEVIIVRWQAFPIPVES